MAIGKLPVDYVQDVIDTSVTDKRRYHMITNTDGTMSLDDVTTYLLKGSEFGADNINQTNQAVNEVIDALGDIEDGSIVVGKATNAARAENAECAINADSAEKLSNSRNINGIPFDGTEDIIVEDNTKIPLDKDFVLINQQPITFINNVATISDTRITADSLADVYFTNDTISIAEKASITVETYGGNVKLTAGRAPEGTLKASIHIRVV